MTTILHIDASASDAESSHSRRLSAHLVERLRGAHPDASVVRRDVVAETLPHVDTRIRAAWSEDAERTAELDEIGTRSRSLVDELKGADVIVVGSPMYNFTVPSTLKAWIDHVAIAGQTFRYTENGPEGLLSDKRVYLALASGGVYSEGPAAGNEFLDSYLRAVFRFLGLSDVSTVRAEGTAMGPDRSAAAMDAAKAEIDRLIG